MLKSHPCRRGTEQQQKMIKKIAKYWVIFFSPIFTKEPQDNDLQLLQEFENRCDDRLDNVEISGEIVCEKLNSVKVKNRKARIGSTQGYWRGVNIV